MHRWIVFIRNLCSKNIHHFDFDSSRIKWIFWNRKNNNNNKSKNISNSSLTPLFHLKKLSALDSMSIWHYYPSINQSVNWIACAPIFSERLPCFLGLIFYFSDSVLFISLKMCLKVELFINTCMPDLICPFFFCCSGKRFANKINPHSFIDHKKFDIVFQRDRPTPTWLQMNWIRILMSNFWKSTVGDFLLKVFNPQHSHTQTNTKKNEDFLQ